MGVLEKAGRALAGRRARAFLEVYMWVFVGIAATGTGVLVVRTFLLLKRVYGW